MCVCVRFLLGKFDTFVTNFYGCTLLVCLLCVCVLDVCVLCMDTLPLRFVVIVVAAVSSAICLP